MYSNQKERDSGKRSVSILGATGSIGLSTLDVIRHNRGKYHIHLLTFHQNLELAIAQVAEFAPSYVFSHHHDTNAKLKDKLAGSKTKVVLDESELKDVLAIRHDVCMVAIMGVAALQPCIAAMSGVSYMGLANKESIVCAWSFIKQIAETNRVRIIPVDSEHNAIYQILVGCNAEKSDIDSITITASGGPFIDLAIDQFAKVTPKDAVLHPNWSMGAKISVDSATMLNKGLEYIEACELFDLPPNKVQAVIHRQSLIHGMVNFADGASVAQLNPPDMRVHIAFALGYPARVASGADALNLLEYSKLTFEPIERERFPLFFLAKEVYQKNDLSLRIKLNVANEIAVQNFLSQKSTFLQMIEQVQSSVAGHTSEKITCIQDIVDLVQEYFANK